MRKSKHENDAIAAATLATITESTHAKRAKLGSPVPMLLLSHTFHAFHMHAPLHSQRLSMLSTHRAPRRRITHSLQQSEARYKPDVTPGRQGNNSLPYLCRKPEALTNPQHITRLSACCFVFLSISHRRFHHGL